MGTGVNISKEVTYAVLTPPTGVAISKEVTYAVLYPGIFTPPTWGSVSAPSGVVGAAYDWSFDMPSAAPTVSYAVTAGALPDGLALDALAGNAAHIHGTPTVVGTFTFTITATNAYGSQDKEFTIVIIDTVGLPGTGGGAWTFLA